MFKALQCGSSCLNLLRQFPVRGWTLASILDPRFTPMCGGSFTLSHVIRSYELAVAFHFHVTSCKLINDISSIAHLNCQQIGFISYHIVNTVVLMLVFYHIVLINGFIS